MSYLSSRNNSTNNARRLAVRAAVQDEIRRFGLKLATTRPVLRTAFGEYVVDNVDADFNVSAHPVQAQPNWMNVREFQIANDIRWHDLMLQVGESRHPLFA